jgi:hypothetical protein
MKKIGIIGCGWLGIRLAKHLAPNYQIFVTTTSQEKANELSKLGFEISVANFDEIKNQKLNEVWLKLDSIIITVPFPKSGNTDVLKNRFQNISNFINGFEGQLFLMSSIGIYPQFDQVISETNLDESLLNPTIFGIEHLMKQNFPEINILRLAGLMGDDRYLSKYKISEPQQIVNHIHFEDIAHILEKMISDNSTKKTYNLVAPLHPTKQQVIDFQTKNLETKIDESFGRKIASEFVESELNYQFLHSDPRRFK